MAKLLRIISLLLLAIPVQAQFGRGFFPSSPDGNGLLAGLQAYWNLDEASGSVIDAHSTHDLTEYGGDGLGSGTGELNGDRIYAISELASSADAAWNELNTLSWTFVCWVKLGHLGSAGQRQFLCAKDDAGGLAAGSLSYAVEYFHAGDGTKSFAAYVSTDGTAFTRALVTPGGAGIVTGTWYFVAARFNTTLNTMTVSFGEGSTLTHGTPTAQGGTAFPVSEDFALGGCVDIAHGTFASTLRDNAELDESALWQRHLSDSDLALIFNGGTPLPYSSFTN